MEEFNDETLSVMRRVEKEYKDLTEKIIKLGKFLDIGEISKQRVGVGNTQYCLLNLQYKAMILYQNILDQRLDDFKADNELKEK